MSGMDCRRRVDSVAERASSNSGLRLTVGVCRKRVAATAPLAGGVLALVVIAIFTIGGPALASVAGRVADGGFGRDRMVGTSRGDDLSGGSGSDRLIGRGGGDRLDGGSGNDRLDGGPGNDRLTSVDGRRDTVDCGSGRDVAFVDSKDRVRGCERTVRSSR